MKPMIATITTLVAASANNIALSQTPGGAGNLTLNGSAVASGVATLDQARRVLITAAANETGHNFTITGTDRGNNVITEVVAGPNTTTAFTNQDFKTVTSVAISAAATGAVTVGTNQVISSRWLNLDDHANAQISLQVDVAGTVNYTVESTLCDPGVSSTYPLFATVPVYPHPNLTAQTTSKQDNYAFKPKYARITLNSYTVATGAGVTLTVIEAGGLSGT